MAHDGGAANKVVDGVVLGNDLLSRLTDGCQAAQITLHQLDLDSRILGDNAIAGLGESASKLFLSLTSSRSRMSALTCSKCVRQAPLAPVPVPQCPERPCNPPHLA